MTAIMADASKRSLFIIFLCFIRKNNKSFPFSALFLCPVRCFSLPFVASPFRSFRCFSLPFVPFPQRQQIPRFGAVAESHSAWPLATGSLIIHLILLPPSEGVQYSRVFVSPSEGVWSRHIFESALCQCFSCHRGIPTFRRCAGFPRFRLTFRRCAVSGAADATILKRPDVLCRKTSIAITRILVFLPLFNRK